MKIKSSLSRLIIIGLLAAAPAAAFAQQSPPSEPAARDGRTYTGGRHHPDPAAKGINQAGIKKTDAPPAALTVTPPAEAGKGITQSGVKKAEDAPPAALTVAPPAEAGKGHSEKGVK